MDLVGTVLDEVALEGLEGITLSSLWVRLSDTKFSLNPDDENVRQFIWFRIIVPKAAIKDVQLFRLPQPRPTIQLYNRYDYVNSDTGACIENDDVPEDVYGTVTPISDGTVRGSCTTFETRVDVTKTILGKYLSQLKICVHKTNGDIKIYIWFSFLFLQKKTFLSRKFPPNMEENWLLLLVRNFESFP